MCVYAGTARGAHPFTNERVRNHRRWAPTSLTPNMTPASGTFANMLLSRVLFSGVTVEKSRAPVVGPDSGERCRAWPDSKERCRVWTDSEER